MVSRWSALPLALLGVMAAHEATYRLAAHEHVHRHDLLESTGHSWLSLSSPLLMALTALTVASGWALAGRGGRPPRLWQVAAIQSGIFVAVEVVERLASGHDPIPAANIILLGSLTQLPVAVLVWLAFTKVIIPALTLSGHLGVAEPPLPPCFLARVAYDFPFYSRRSWGSLPARGPPSLA